MIPSMTYVGLAALVLIIFNSLTFTNGFDCYTGDGEILRRKTCPNFANICFKKMPGCKYYIWYSVVLFKVMLHNLTHYSLEKK